MTKVEEIDKLPWATWSAGLLLLIVAGVGAAITIIEPKTLSFADYCKDVATLAVGVGLVAVGRGANSAGKQSGGAAAGAGQVGSGQAGE